MVVGTSPADSPEELFSCPEAIIVEEHVGASTFNGARESGGGGIEASVTDAGAAVEHDSCTCCCCKLSTTTVLATPVEWC